ncbi:hypothetical protein BH23VER1_BH23VER1_21860 [soil metagenome]
MIPMTKPFWISLGCATLATTVVLAAQSARNHRLGQRLEKASATVARLDSTGSPSHAFPAQATPNARPSAAGGPEDAAHPAPAKSATRVADASAQIDQLAGGLEGLEGSPAGLFKILPDVLRVVENLTLDEMIAVAEGIEDDATLTEPSGTGVIRAILYSLAAEQDPARLVRNNELMKEQEFRLSLLGALARRDPEAARRWLLNSDISEREKQETASMLAIQVMRRDLDAGLPLLRLASPQVSSWSSRPLFLPDEALPDLVAAMDRPENADIRPLLLNLAIGSVAHAGDLEDARQRIDQLGIAPEDVATAFDDGPLLRRIDADPAELLDWMQDVQTPEQLQKSFPHALRRWAERDYNAAAEWLGQMDSSPLKDAAIERFSQTVTGIDPQAAIIWAGEIQDTHLRARALVGAAERWIVSDKPTADRWLADAGLDLDTLRQERDAAESPAPPIPVPTSAAHPASGSTGAP